jgi:methionine sulfoxide reductase catalytic subunit
LHFRKQQEWEVAERDLTPERAFWKRREWLAALGAASLVGAEKYELDRPLTAEWAATTYNNFYEFTVEKEQVRKLTDEFVVTPWSVEVAGLVAKPQRFDLDDLKRRMPMEERRYRHRCVEAWSMAVPWTGFALRHLLAAVEPLPAARWVRFVSVNRPEQMPGIRTQNWYPWPYHEALRLDEAMNDLAFVATGIYGKALPKQNGAPLRLALPWKYGFKGPKSMVKIELVAERPETFWNKLQPKEYGFYSNVNPKKAHPRWSQAVETVIPHMERRATLPYNGYGSWVAGLYRGDED